MARKLYIEPVERRCKNMKAFMKKLESLFVAATFAQAGEFDTARNI